jgi:hypothetical protein
VTVLLPLDAHLSVALQARFTEMNWLITGLWSRTGEIIII